MFERQAEQNSQRFRKLALMRLVEGETVLEFQVDRDQQRDEIVTLAHNKLHKFREMNRDQRRASIQSLLVPEGRRDRWERG